MKKTIYRYIAIAFGVLALPLACIEILAGGIPFMSVLFAAAAKGFYDESVGRVSDQSKSSNQFFMASDHTASDTFPSLSLDHHHRMPHSYDYNGVSESAARGEHPYGGGPI